MRVTLHQLQALIRESLGKPNPATSEWDKWWSTLKTFSAELPNSWLSDTQQVYLDKLQSEGKSPPSIYPFLWEVEDGLHDQLDPWEGSKNLMDRVQDNERSNDPFDLIYDYAVHITTRSGEEFDINTDDGDEAFMHAENDLMGRLYNLAEDGLIVLRSEDRHTSAVYLTDLGRKALEDQANFWDDPPELANRLSEALESLSDASDVVEKIRSTVRESRTMRIKRSELRRLIRESLRDSPDSGELAARMFAIDGELSYWARNWNHNLGHIFKLQSRLASKPDKLARLNAKFDPGYWLDTSEPHLSEIRDLDPGLADDIVTYLSRFGSLHESPSLVGLLDERLPDGWKPMLSLHPNASSKDFSIIGVMKGDRPWPDATLMFQHGDWVFDQDDFNERMDEGWEFKWWIKVKKEAHGPPYELSPEEQDEYLSGVYRPEFYTPTGREKRKIGFKATVEQAIQIAEQVLADRGL